MEGAEDLLAGVEAGVMAQDSTEVLARQTLL